MHTAWGADAIEALVEAPHDLEPCWPAIDRLAGAVLLLGDVYGPDGARSTEQLWRAPVGRDRAASTFEWMVQRPGSWSLWGRAIQLFGEQALASLVVDESEREATSAQISRIFEKERRRQRDHIRLILVGSKGPRPGLALCSGDPSQAFFKMRFGTRGKRDRVLDWLRWQEPRFAEFRNVVERDGREALERLIVADLCAVEADLTKRGLATPGQRPLQFWMGE